MKPRLIIAASMLLTTASFAQTTTETTKNATAIAAIEAHKPAITGKGAGEANSRAVLKTEAVPTVQENTLPAMEKVKHGKKEKKEKKEPVVNPVAKEKAAAQSVVSQDASVATRSTGRTKVKANQGKKKIEEETPVTTGTGVEVVNDGPVVKQEQHGATVRAAAAEVSTTANTTNGVKAVAVKTPDKVNATGATRVKIPAKKVKAVKITPASVRATTRANSNSGIRVR